MVIKLVVLVSLLVSCGFEKSADMMWLGARDAVNRAYQHSETELENCFQKNGCSPRGPQGKRGDSIIGPAGQAGIDGAVGPKGEEGKPGKDGIDGAQGPAGPAGKDGEQGPQGEQGPVGPAGQDGAGCSVASATGGVLVICGDTTEFISHGQDGKDGEDGTDGILEIIDPCGDHPNHFDEIIIRVSTNELFAYFEDGGNRRFLAILPPGNYRTTDRQKCDFTVTSSLGVIW